MLEYFKTHWTFAGDKIDARGCWALGIDEGTIHQWTEGVDFETEHLQDRYSKTPYLVIYQ